MSGPSTSTNGADAQQRVDWSALRSYISQKEAFESENGRPAPLTEAELSAITVLLRPAQRPDPDLGGRNWISHLNHFLQVRRQTVTFKDEARQEPRLGKAPELRWACFVTFDTTGDQFPQPGHGIEDDRSPDFNRKQDAKQYAAKSACEWLTANGYMLPSGELPKFHKAFDPAAASATVSVPAKRPNSPPIEAAAGVVRTKQEILPTRSPSTSAPPNPENRASSPKKKPPKAPKTEGASTPQSQPLTTSASASISTSTSTSTSSSSAVTPAAGAALATNPLDNSNGGDAEVPVAKRVEAICRRLKYPVPHYVLRPDASLGGDFWTGYPDFDGHPRIPDNLGAVTTVLTKKAAKERIAEIVLDWMHEQLEERERAMRAVLGE